MTKIEYGYEELRRIPDAMAPWGMQLVMAPQSIYDPWPGEYVLVGVDQATIELHHQAEVVDESGDPLDDIWVIFGFPGGGPDLGRLTPKENYWPGAPAVLKGNAQKTSLAGYAQHTFREGGESIWIWDVDDEGILRLPSPIVRGSKWVGSDVGHLSIPVSGCGSSAGARTSCHERSGWTNWRRGWRNSRGFWGNEKSPVIQSSAR